MSLKHQYIVTFFTTPFNSLEAAKWNVEIAFTRKEAIKYIKGQDVYIYHFIGDKLHSETPIHVDDHGNISFGRTRKVT